MILSHKRRFVFVHIHKTAGEAVTMALLPFLGRGDLVLGTTRLGRIRNLVYRHRFGLSKHSKAAKIRDYVGNSTWEESFTFALVRHPFDRARSLYRYFDMVSAARAEPGLAGLAFRLPGLSRGDPLNWPGLRAYRETTSFSEFIRHPGFRGDMGGRSQRDALVDGEGRLLVDFVGHCERIDADFAEVTERIGVRGAVLPRHNVSAGKGAASVALTDDDKAALAELYAADLEMFQFPSEPV
jgi:hypothetical protein